MVTLSIDIWTGGIVSWYHGGIVDKTPAVKRGDHRFESHPNRTIVYFFRTTRETLSIQSVQCLSHNRVTITCYYSFRILSSFPPSHLYDHFSVYHGCVVVKTSTFEHGDLRFVSHPCITIVYFCPQHSGNTENTECCSAYHILGYNKQ